MDIPAMMLEAEAICKRRGLVIDHVCRDIGINGSTWRRWRTGAAQPNLRNLGPLLDRFPSLRCYLNGRPKETSVRGFS